MLSRANRRRSGGDNTWPGFVDALSSLLLVIIFLLSMFVLAQFFLGQALSGKDKALASLQTQAAELANLLRLEQQANEGLRVDIGDLAASLLKANDDKETLRNRVTEIVSDLDEADARILTLEDLGQKAEADFNTLKVQYIERGDEITAEQALTAQAQAEVVRLNNGISALRQQLSRLEVALDASEQKDLEQKAVIVDLGKRLNVALAAKVEELAQFRSVFFERLRNLLGARNDIRIEGDRFVFSAEVLFQSGSATLQSEGIVQMATFGRTLLIIADTIPDDVSWVLRVDGHSDLVPISTVQFPSNWELSTARATSVVKFLISEGVPPSKLAATGFGEFQPLIPNMTPEANLRNRRIEMRLTER